MELHSAIRKDQTHRRQLTNRYTRGIFGRMKTYNPGANYTVNLCMELACRYASVRIGIPNIHNAAVSGVKVSVAVTDSNHAQNYINNINPSTNVWYDLTQTVNGTANPSATLTPRVADEVISVTWMDEISLRSLPQGANKVGTGKPLLMVRIEYPSGAILTIPFNGLYYWRTQGSHRLLRASVQAVQGVTNKAAFTTANTEDVNVVVPFVQYTGLSDGHQVVVSGDSNAAGMGATVRDYGPVSRFSDKLMKGMEQNGEDLPVEYCNLGLLGQGVAVYSRYLTYLLPHIKPTLAFFSPYSINDVSPGGMTVEAQDTMYRCICDVLAAHARMGASGTLIMLAGLPCTVAFRNVGPADALRTSIGPKIPGNSYIWYPEYPLPVTGNEVNGQREMLSSYNSGDGVHFNDGGQEALAGLLLNYVMGKFI